MKQSLPSSRSCLQQRRERWILRTTLLLPWAEVVVAAAILGPDALRPGWRALGLFLGGFALTAIGLEVGFHRLFTHRAFSARPALRAALLILGATAAQSPVFGWASAHRRHHQHSDQAGDQHSPYAYGRNLRDRVRGFWHAHIAWLWNYNMKMEDYRLVSDLIDDPVIYRLGRLHMHSLWTALGLLCPSLLGLGLIGGWTGAVQGFLWGGALRVLAAQNLILAVNSLGHSFGSRPFKTQDESRDNPWLALPTLGAGWHNTHHAFPDSYSNQWTWRRPDPGAWIIRILAAAGLACNLKSPASSELQAKKC